jgi:predicted nucleic acid-binding protein
MILVDTSAWIEHLLDTPVGRSVDQKLPEREEWLVPTIVQLELAKWLAREVGEDAAEQVIAFTQKCVVIPLDTPIALDAAEICRSHKLATADAIVYATARAHEAMLLTCDAHFSGMDNVELIPKA